MTLLPVLRPMSWLAAARRDGDPGDPLAAPVWTFAGDGLVSALTRRDDTGWRDVTAGELATTGTSVLGAFDRATAGLIDGNRHLPAPGHTELAADSCADSTRLRFSVRPARVLVVGAGADGGHAPGVQLGNPEGLVTSWLAHPVTLRALTEATAAHFGDIPLYFPVSTGTLLIAPVGADGLDLLYRFARAAFLAAGTDGVSPLAYHSDGAALRLWTPGIARPERIHHLDAQQLVSSGAPWAAGARYSGQGVYSPA